MNQTSIDFLAEIGARSNPFPGLRPFEYEESHLFFGRDGQSQQLIAKLGQTRFLAVIGTSGSGKSSLVRAGLLPALYGGFMKGAGSAWRVAIMRPGNDPIGNLARALNDTEVFGSDDAENNALQVAITEATLRRGSLGLIEAVRQANMPATENLLIVADQFEEIFRVEQGRRDEEYENDKAAFVKLLLGAQRQPIAPPYLAQAQDELSPKETSQHKGSKDQGVKDDSPKSSLRPFDPLTLRVEKAQSVTVSDIAAPSDVRVYVALTMRSDYLGDCAQFWDLPEAINAGQYLIPRLTREQRRHAITGPIAVAGGEITPRLVNRLLNDVGDNPDQLPILQHALMRTWDEWTNQTPAHAAVHAGAAIDLCCYEAIGGMAEALSRHADEAYTEVGHELGARGQLIAEKMFKALTEKGADNRETRRPITLGEICNVTDASPAEVAAIIEIFRAPGRSFLTPPVGTPLDADSLIDISHESLIRGWKGHEDENGAQQKRLKEWVEEEAGCARIYIRLADTAVLHQAGQAGLWRDPDLKLALIWREANQPNRYWTRRYHPEFDLAMAFLQASKQAQENEIAERARAQQERLEQAEALAAAQRQRLEEQTKSASRLRRFATGLVIAALLALLAAVFAFSAYLRAEQQKQLADSTAYVASLNLARSEFERGNHQRGYELLDAYLPANNAAQKQDDLRSFYWYYLWYQNYPLLATLSGHTEYVNAVAFSPDGRTLASASEDASVKLWDVASGKELATLGGGPQYAGRTYLGYTLGGHAREVNAVAFSPDGRTLATASSDWSVKLWDVISRKELTTLGEHRSSVWSVAFAPDGRTLASASEDKTVKLWDVATQKELATLGGHGALVRAVAFSPDGRTLASASNDKKVKLWDVATQKELITLSEHKDYVNAVAFSPDGRTLASASEDETVKLWDVATQKALATLGGHGKFIGPVAFSPDGRTLASTVAGSIKLWDVASRKELATLGEHGAIVNSGVFSPDGRTLASAGWDKTLKLWDVASRTELTTLGAHRGSVNSLVFSPDGRTLAGASAGKLVELWDVASRKELATLGGHGDWVRSVAFSPNGRMLASASDDMTVKLWDVVRRKELTTLRGHWNDVLSVAFSPDGRMLASTSIDKTVKLWDVASQKELVTLSGHREAVLSVAFSPDGRTLASASWDKTVKLWDVASHRELVTLSGHEEVVSSVTFSPDGRTLASASWDMSVKLWDVASRKELTTLRGHGKFIESVAFSPDGRTLASASNDRSVKLWDVVSHKELVTLSGHEGDVNSVAFSSDGRTLVSASADGTVKLWTGATNAEVARRQNK